MIANDESPDISEHTLAVEATDRIDAADPTLPMLSTEPMLPMLSTLFREPIDSSEFDDR